MRVVGWKGSEGTDTALFLALEAILSRSGAGGSGGGDVPGGAHPADVTGRGGRRDESLGLSAQVLNLPAV